MTERKRSESQYCWRLQELNSLCMHLHCVKSSVAKSSFHSSFSPSQQVCFIPLQEHFNPLQLYPVIPSTTIKEKKMHCWKHGQLILSWIPNPSAFFLSDIIPSQVNRPNYCFFTSGWASQQSFTMEMIEEKRKQQHPPRVWCTGTIQWRSETAPCERVHHYTVLTWILYGRKHRHQNLGKLFWSLSWKMQIPLCFSSEVHH